MANREQKKNKEKKKPKQDKVKAVPSSGFAGQKSGGAPNKK